MAYKNIISRKSRIIKKELFYNSSPKSISPSGASIKNHGVTPGGLPCTVRFAVVGAVVGTGVTEAVGVGVGVNDGVGVFVAVGTGVSVGVGIGVSVGVEVAVGMGVSVCVGVGVLVSVGVCVADGVRVPVVVGVSEPVGVGVCVSVMVGVFVGAEDDDVGDGVEVGVSITGPAPSSNKLIPSI